MPDDSAESGDALEDSAEHLDTLASVARTEVGALKAAVDGLIEHAEHLQERHGGPDHGLDCPVPTCDERFHDRHDESATTSLVYHIAHSHEELHKVLVRKLTSRGADDG